MGLSPVALFEAAYSDVSSFSLPDLSGMFNPGTGYKQFASTYLLQSIIRKWIPVDSSEADQAALNSFTAANNRCREWSFLPEWEVDNVVLGQTKKILEDFFNPKGEPLVQSLFDLLRAGRPGPGAGVAAKGTSYYNKYFASQLSSTSLYLYEEYRNYASWIPFLSDAECLRYDKFGSPSIVSGSRCSFVPKTTATSRMICVEPTVNMFYQLGLAALLEERLRSFFGIDLKTQPQVNHRLAYLGSKDGSYATIDLSSASDSISLRLCELLLPKWVFDLLILLRSRTTRINGVDTPLFMISTMGNGFTFPLQTIIFSAVTKAVIEIYSAQYQNPIFSVFGDDIICPAHCCKQLVRFLGLLNFKVNTSKTFLEGPFRESCGSDWFNGQPVRPVFVRKLNTPYDYFVTINALNEWSAYTGIPLRNTVRLLARKLPKKFTSYVPFESNADSGIRVPSTFLTDKKFDSNMSFLFKSWERVPSKIIIWEEGKIRFPGNLRRFEWLNPPGLYCSFLFGELESYSISVRLDRRLYRRRLRCTPRWDYIPTDSLTNGVKLSWQQWETAVSINLDKP